MKKRKAPSTQGAGFNLPIGSVVTFIIMGAAAYSLSWEQTAERLSAAGSALGMRSAAAYIICAKTSRSCLRVMTQARSSAVHC